MTDYSLIAQSVERRTVNPQVPGSSPGRGAKQKALAHPRPFCSRFGVSAGVVEPDRWIGFAAKGEKNRL